MFPFARMDGFGPRAPPTLMDRRVFVGGDGSLRSPDYQGVVDRRVYVNGDGSLRSPGASLVNG